MNVRSYRKRNNLHRMAMRLRYPPPLYKRVGGMAAIVTRADGSKEDLGTISDAFAKRWGVGTNQ